MKSTENKILVIGAGAWGSGIANLLASNNHQVFLSSNEPEVVEEVNQKHQNSKYFPGIELNQNIEAILNLPRNDFDFVFIVVPSQIVKIILEQIVAAKFKENCTFVICSKGIESSSLTFLSDVFEDVIKNQNYAVLSGPNFAAEVATKVPSITTIASYNEELGNNVINLLNNDYFKASYSNDPKCAEICGVVKNIIAISCGMIEGLDLGINTKAAAIMKGISEIQLLCKALGASTDVTNAAGFGDIFLTCSSSKSRNNSLGKLIATGGEMDKNTTYEGAVSAKLISALAKKLQLNLDLCEAVSEILANKFTKNEIKEKIVKAILR
jgi:glycerol-3-phosphate dehydrogenase (NAD(P)+)